MIVVLCNTCERRVSYSDVHAVSVAHLSAQREHRFHLCVPCAARLREWLKLKLPFGDLPERLPASHPANNPANNPPAVGSTPHVGGTPARKDRT